MEAIIVALLPFVIRIAGIFLDKSSASAETQQKFLNFVESVQKDFGTAKLTKSYNAQKARMDKIEKENADDSIK